MGTYDLSFEGIRANRSELSQKIMLITKFITEGPQGKAHPNRLHIVRDRAAAILARYDKTSWNIVDQTTYPNSERAAPEGIWGTLSAETPNSLSALEVDRATTPDYSMVLTLHKIGSTQIEVPLIEDEKEVILDAISSLRTRYPSKNVS